MSFIDIITNNESKQLRDATTFADNWVYVPGVAITGDWKKPYKFNSLDEFRSVFGNYGPENSITYEYVSGLLASGLPVLFRRIACTNQGTQSETLAVTRAQYVVTHIADESEENAEPITDMIIQERFGGSYGNSLSVRIRKSGSSVYAEVYDSASGDVLVEKQKLFNFSPTDTDAQLDAKLKEELAKTGEDYRYEYAVDVDSRFRTIKITVPTETGDNFKFFGINDDKLFKLAGGADLPASFDINAEIKRGFDLDTTVLKDKLLYQPKFLTTGGYTDSNEILKSENVTSSMTYAMIQLSKARQDCRAIVDLIAGTHDYQEVQTIATNLSYTQSNSRELIPSAMICHPWCYMTLNGTNIWMPPSFAYLTVVGNDLSNGGVSYTPKAGLASGRIQNVVRTEFDIGEDVMNAWQADGKAQINPINRIQGSTFVISGNSTLLLKDEDEENAFAESSADLTVIEIRRFVYDIASELQYNYNSAIAWENFSLRTSKFLNQMKAIGAIMGFDITNISSNREPRKLKVRLNVDLTPTIKNIEIYLNVSYGSIEVTGGVS